MLLISIFCKIFISQREHVYEGYMLGAGKSCWDAVIPTYQHSRGAKLEHLCEHPSSNVWMNKLCPYGN